MPRSRRSRCSGTDVSGIHVHSRGTQAGTHGLPRLGRGGKRPGIRTTSRRLLCTLPWLLPSQWILAGGVTKLTGSGGLQGSTPGPSTVPPSPVTESE
jgi:hypothetical protein